MKIIKSYQVPEGNISPDIFKLPCVNGAIKHDEFGIIYRLYDSVKVENFLAIPTDWICKYADGR